MKITQEQLRQIVAEELESQLQEGVFDYLKGAGKAAGGKVADTGKSVANAISNKANAVKNKVGQVAGDIKSAGATSSLKADIQKTAQDAGMQIQGLIDRFTDLLARAQSMRMEEEESIIKAELQALRNYQETAAAESSPSGIDTSHGEEPKTSGGVPTSPEGEHDVQAMKKPSVPKPVQMGTKPNPAAVDFGHGEDVPFDWSSKPKMAHSKPAESPKPATPPKKAPQIRTKLDRASIEKAVKAAGGSIPQAAKNLGITKDQMIKALGR